MTVADLATEFPITGLVSNVSDGSVDLIAEGEAAELQTFYDAILQRMSRNIVDHRAEWYEITSGSFTSFGIGADKMA